MRTALATAYAAITLRPATLTSRPRLVVIADAGEPVIPETLDFLGPDERRALDLVLERSAAELRRFIRRRVMQEVLATDEVRPRPASAPAAANQDAAARPATLWRQRALLEREGGDIEAAGRSDELVVARLGRRISGAVVLALHIGLFAKHGGGAWARTLERKHARVAGVLRRARDGDGRARLIARLASQAARDRVLGHIRAVDHQLRLQARRDLACFERAVGRSFDSAEARAVVTAILTVQRWLHLRAGGQRPQFTAQLVEFIPAGPRACIEAALG